MDLLFILLGLFLVGAVASNKDIGGKKANGQSKDIGDTIAINGLWAFMAGLGFIIPTLGWASMSYNLLIPIYLFIATVLVFAKGPLLVIGKVAIFGMITFIIMGSYM